MHASAAPKYLYFLLISFLLFSHTADATVYSDAENGIGNWFVSDNTPSGAVITSVFDAEHGSRVIQTDGTQRSNRYSLGGFTTAQGWDNRTEHILSWDMRADEPVAFFIFLETDYGVRRLMYNNSNANSLNNPNNNSIHYGLGSALIGGGWLSYSRDLAAEVALGEPGNTLIAVNGITAAGSIRLDNIALNNGDVDVDLPPTAEIETNTVSGSAPLTVTFSAAASTAVAPATIASYAWDFGNGTTATSTGASNTYTNTGSYTVSLTVTDSNGLSSTATTSIVVQAVEPPPPSGEREAAARLLAQATFGPTLSDIAEVERLGIEGWVDDQFTRQGAPHLEYVQNYPRSGSLRGPRHFIWMIDAIDGDDQLRQRVAFAYSQLFVVSDVSQTLGYAQHQLTNYYDILRNNAFGNYRDLLEEVTLSPIMGLYLSMLQNGQADFTSNTRADENFAREVMQLFSIGLYELNLDGSIRRDADGNPLPAYTQEDVEEYARVYTGWNYADADRWTSLPTSRNTNKFLPMEPYPGFHDEGAKNLLRGGVSPAGISPQQDLANALDSLFNHPNVGPFIGEQLIKRLVTSNPTPAYIARVASAFNNNGSGVRGDMRAVIRAILLDTEAREGYMNVPNYGKIREPLIRWTHLWRSFNVQRGANSTFNQYNTGSPYIQASASFLGQQVLGANSVFNFYHPDYAPLGPIRDANLTAPETEIYSDANILTTTAKMSFLAHRFYQGAGANELNSSHIDISAETAMAADPSALIDHLDLLLMSGQMSADMRTILLNHMNSLPADEAGRSLRVRDGITLIIASPQYLVQK